MTDENVSLRDLLRPDEPLRPGGRLTVIGIDGNSIGAVAGRLCDGTVHLDAMLHAEPEELVESIHRMRHPVHMDVAVSVFRNRDFLRAQLKKILSQEVFRNPVVILLPPEKVDVAELIGRPTPAAGRERLERLVHAHLPYNPLSYPTVLTAQHLPIDEDHSLTRILVARLADLLPLIRLVRETGAKLAGLFAALSSADRVVRLLPATNSDRPTVLCNLGKLRTVYTTLFPSGKALHFPIPVGLARDDHEYFAGAELRVGELARKSNVLEGLTFSPEATPTPLLRQAAAAAGRHCIHFAVQVACYAQRALETAAAAPGEPEPDVLLLAGPCRRIPGLARFLQNRIGRRVEDLGQHALRGVTLEAGLGWNEVADNLLAVGALKEIVEARPLAHAMLSGELLAPPMRNGSCTISKMQPGVLYVYEQKTRLI